MKEIIKAERKKGKKKGVIRVEKRERGGKQVEKQY